MLSVPREEAAGGLSLGVGVPSIEQHRDEHVGKVSFVVSVDERRLRREHEMEAMRKNSTESFYRSFDRLINGEGPKSSQTLSLDAIQMQFADLASALPQMPLLNEIWSEDVNLQLHSTAQIEKLPPIELECLVKNGVARRLVHFLRPDEFSNLQVEAAWALIKIFCVTSGNTKAESVHETVPCFVRLLDSTRVDVCEQAVFSLGIVADDSREYRDFVLSNGVLVPLFKLLTKHANLGEHANISMLRNLTWTLSILCEDISDSSFEQAKPALTTLERLLHCDDVEVLINSCLTIYALSYDVQFRINHLIDAGLCPKLVEHLLHDSLRVQLPVLLTLVLITFEQPHIQTLIENGVLGPLWTLLTEDRKDQDYKNGDKIIKSLVCGVITGILQGGNERQIQDVINAKIFDHLVKLLESPHEVLQLKAAEAIATATARGSPKQIMYLVNGCKIIKPMCNLVSNPNVNKVEVFLQVVEKVLEAGNKGSDSNPYIELIVGTGCVETIDKICMGEIKCGLDNYDSVPYILRLLGRNPDIDISEI